MSRYLIVECGDDPGATQQQSKDTKHVNMYIAVLKRFSNALMNVSGVLLNVNELLMNISLLYMYENQLSTMNGNEKNHVVSQLFKQEKKSHNMNKVGSQGSQESKRKRSHNAGKVSRTSFLTSITHTDRRIS